MQPIATDDARIIFYVSVCLSHGCDVKKMVYELIEMVDQK